mmetsp:Transcript_8269/g.18480  ORF Transcript_8269/g.18480 Transcript_8269/m.18480 type:complete len:170 (-) Transcript_8269:108-617(-)
MAAFAPGVGKGALRRRPIYGSQSNTRMELTELPQRRTLAGSSTSSASSSCPELLKSGSREMFPEESLILRTRPGARGGTWDWEDRCVTTLRAPLAGFWKGELGLGTGRYGHSPGHPRHYTHSCNAKKPMVTLQSADLAIGKLEYKEPGLRRRSPYKDWAEAAGLPNGGK